MALAIGQTKDSLHKCSKSSLAVQQGFKGNTAISVSRNALSVSQNPEIPAQTLFDFIASTQKTSATLPPVAECATHLELLQVFHDLRTRVLASTEFDEVLEIRPEPRTVFETKYTYGYGGHYTRTEKKLRDETFDERRKLKWPLYLNFAAARFLRWVDAVEDDPDAALVSVPKIDVIMVWHALLLNPLWFRTFEHRKLEMLERLDFPWQQIHESIAADGKTFTSSYDLLLVLEKAQTSTKLIQILRKHHASMSSSTELENHHSVLSDGSAEPLSKSANATITALVEAVQRQSKFVEKMENQLWIRSPAVQGTLTRATTRYSQFLKLFKLYPGTTLVPTLDIDLVWHTHQCSPAQYTAAAKEIAGRFIDHDDKIVSMKLETGMQKTIDLYKTRFGGDYNYCCCWDCEALRSAIHEQRTDMKGKGNAESIARKVVDDLAYYRSVEIARRGGEKLLPIRN